MTTKLKIIIIIIIFCSLSCSMNRKCYIQVIDPYISHYNKIQGKDISKTIIEFDTLITKSSKRKYAMGDTSYYLYDKKINKYLYKKLPIDWYNSSFRHYCSVSHQQMEYNFSYNNLILYEELIFTFIPYCLQVDYNFHINKNDTVEVVQSHLINPEYKIIVYKKNNIDTIYAGHTSIYDAEMIKSVNTLYGDTTKEFEIIKFNKYYYLVNKNMYTNTFLDSLMPINKIQLKNNK